MYEFKKIFKRNYRIVCLLLSCFLSFGTVTTEYLTVQAFDWVVPSLYLPFDGAIPYLMGLLGVAPEENSLFTEEDYKAYLLENGYTEEDLENENGRYAEWVDDICNGALNQASEFWLQFKNWVSHLTFESGNTVVTGSLSSVFSSIPVSINWTYSPSDIADTSIDSKFGYFVVDENTNNFKQAEIFVGVDSVSFVNENGYLKYYLTFENSISYYGAYSSSVSYYSSVGNTKERKLNFTGYKIYVFGVPDSVVFPDNVYKWDIGFTSALNVYNQALIDKLSFVLSDAISSSIPDVLPLPWDQIGDTVDEVKDYIDGLIEQVNSGVISISDYMRAVLDKIGALAVDVATDLLYPVNPDNPDETLDDKANENKNNQGFVLFGLEKVFPFCIPFDIYAFLTLLVAEPVAPVIDWPVYNPITQQNEIITIDFSIWNSVVVLFRYIFDFLFIIGMLLMSRALIGGGDSA